MATVLWGARRGDVQYGSRDFWRRNIPIGAPRLRVSWAQHFDVGMYVDITSWGRGDRDVLLRVVGKEGDELGVRVVSAMEAVNTRKPFVEWAPMSPDSDLVGDAIVRGEW